MDKNRIIKLAFLVLSGLFFVILASMYAVSINHRILKEAEFSVQIHANKETYKIFNEKIVSYYYSCMNKSKENQKIYNDYKSCDEILDAAAVVEDEFLVNIPFDFYNYNWFSEQFSDKNGNVVYKMTIEDKYSTRLHCLKRFAQGMSFAIPISLICSIVFYFILVLIKNFVEFLIKKCPRKFLYALAALIIIYLGYNFSFNLMNQSTSNTLMNFNKAVMLPAGTDIVFKIIVDIFCALLIYKEIRFGKLGFWFYTFFIIAIIFNPIVPVLVGIEMNGFINIFIGIVLLVYLAKEYKNYSR